MELEELKNNMLDLLENDVVFYYHLTGKDNGSTICDKGLFFDNEKLSSTASDLGDGFFEDPVSYVSYDLGSAQTRAKDIMVLIAFIMGEEKYTIQKIDDEYMIPSENILGFVDLATHSFTINSANEFGIGENNLKM